MPTHLEELNADIERLYQITEISPAAAVLMAGAITENLCYTALHLDTQTSDASFCSWLRELEQRRLLDRRVASRMHEMRKVTNACRHHGYRPSQDEALALVDDVEAVIEAMLPISILLSCCGLKLRIAVRRFLQPPGRNHRGVCPSCREPLQIRFEDLDSVRREAA